MGDIPLGQIPVSITISVIREEIVVTLRLRGLIPCDFSFPMGNSHHFIFNRTKIRTKDEEPVLGFKERWLDYPDISI